MARRRSFGSIITARRGFGSLKNPTSFTGLVVPPLLGGSVSGAATVLVRHFTKTPEAGTEYTDTMKSVFKHAPLIGLGAGALTAGAMYYLGGKHAAVSALVGAVAVSSAQLAHDYITQPAAATELAASFPHQTVRGLNAIALERSLAGRRGVGAMLLEPQAGRGYSAGAIGSYGETVNVNGIRGVNASAFGTQNF